VKCGLIIAGCFAVLDFLEVLLQLNFKSKRLIATKIKIEIVIVKNIDFGINNR